MKLRQLLSLLVLVMLLGVITGCGIELSESAVDADEYLGSRSTPEGSGVRTQISRPDQLEVLAAKYGDRMLPLAPGVMDIDTALEAVRSGHERFGRIDVVISNAGYGDISAVEDVTSESFQALE